MKESLLWKHLKPELKRYGKFQKISDRFTPGVPDVLGCCPTKGGVALELKEFSGVHRVKLSFRPGQLDWLRDWSLAGGTSYIVSSHRSTVTVHSHQLGAFLEAGCSLKEALGLSVITFTKTPKTRWADFTERLMK